MGKIFDFVMTGGDWEEYQRIQLYKKLGKHLEDKPKNKNENSN